MKVKIKDLVKFPEKKDIDGMIRIYGPGHADVCIAEGTNTTIDQIGNIEVELDVEKIEKLIKNPPIKESIYKGIKQFTKIPVWYVGNGISPLVQAIADNFKDLIK